MEIITNKPYWNEKDKRMSIAKKHYNEMKKYDDLIKPSIIYGGGDNVPRHYTILSESENLPISIKETDTVSALFDIRKNYPDKKICVLNFASYKNPGGGFLAGSSAQEESLCLESNLYNILIKEENYYNWNRGRLNKGLYIDRAIYSPDVRFFHNNKETVADVITCAAPNFGAASIYQKVSKKENDFVLRDRITFIHNIMVEQNVEIAILGAFGCGVFRQDAKTVANIMFETFNKKSDHDILAVYAVPSFVHRTNYEMFQKTARNWEYDNETR